MVCCAALLANNILASCAYACVSHYVKGVDKFSCSGAALLADDILASCSSSNHAPAADEVATSQFYQVQVLSIRFLRSWYRCPVNLAIQAAQYIFFALLIGTEPDNPQCSPPNPDHGRQSAT